MIVTVDNDRVVEVRGNPDHPFTDGRLCVKVNHYEERVHHPDRVLHPLKRTGPKGSGTFARISWPEALGEIASRFLCHHAWSVDRRATALPASEQLLR